MINNISDFKGDYKIEEQMTECDWKTISIYNMSPSFIRQYFNKLNKDVLSKIPSLPLEIIEEYKDELNWKYLSKYNKSLSSSTIKLYEDYISFDELSKNTNLSVYDIKEYKNKLNIVELLSSVHITDEKLLFELCGNNDLYWYIIALYQPLRVEFIAEHKDKIDKIGRAHV